MLFRSVLCVCIYVCLGVCFKRVCVSVCVCLYTHCPPRPPRCHGPVTGAEPAHFLHQLPNVELYGLSEEREGDIEIEN